VALFAEAELVGAGHAIEQGHVQRISSIAAWMIGSSPRLGAWLGLGLAMGEAPGWEGSSNLVMSDPERDPSPTKISSRLLRAHPTAVSQNQQLSSKLLAPTHHLGKRAEKT